MLNGFGAEKIGLAALRAPVIATLVVAFVTLLAAAGIFRLGYSGANIDMLRDGSQEIADYDELLNSFRNFNNDAIVLLRGNSLDTVEGIETYRDLHFDFQFDEQVESVLSLFSLVRYNIEEGGWRSALPARFDSDEEVKEALAALARDIPNSRSLFDPQGESAVMVVYVSQEAVQDATVRNTVNRFKQLADQYASDDLQITIAGQPAIRSDLIVSIVGDMIKLLPLAAIFCASIAWLIFRNITAVFVCVAAPICAMIWLVGGMGLAGIDITFLTNILPVLIVVVVFSDSLHLFMKWNRLTAKGNVSNALRDSVSQVGPACALSAMTTALALFSLVLAGNHGLIELGTVGGIAMLASLAAVLVVTPLAIYWANRAGLNSASEKATRLSRMAGPAIAAFQAPVPVVIVGSVLTVVGLVAHFQIESRFRLVDYLSADSSVAQSEGFIDEAYPGTTPLFVIVRIDRSKPTLDPANLDRFYTALGAVGRVFPSSSFYSLADFRDEIEKGGGAIKEEDFDELPEYMTRRFIAPDRDKGLITIFSSANMEAAEMRDLVNRLRQELASEGLQDFTAVTGYPVLSSIVAPNLMDKLRLSLIAAIVMSIVLVMVSARSARLGLACLLPNLLPVVSVELVLWLAGIPLNMSITVALTVAFGLAINDSIHLLNQYMIQRMDSAREEAMAEALRQVISPMVSSTLILVGGLVIMMFSTLPLIVLFSAVMILTLIFAIVFNVFQLPAMLLLLENGSKSPEIKSGVHNREVGG